jgi:DNA-binding PadR family transcriptional regulator
MALSHAILATLLSGPISGYKLTKRFNSAIGYFWQSSHQQIYRELAALEEHGYIECMPSSLPSMEKRYALTTEGYDILRKWVAQPSDPGVLREDLLIKIRAGFLTTPDVLVAELRRRHAIHAERLAIYRDIQAHDFSNPEYLSYEQQLLYLPLLRGLMFEAGNVAWCDAAIDFLQTGRSPLDSLEHSLFNQKVDIE